MSEPRLIHISQAYLLALDYIKARQQGAEKSIKTPWNKVNLATMNGLEWNNIIIVAGRPGSGKTMFTNMITREAHRLNPDERLMVLDFQFEMHAKNIALREFAAGVGKTIDELSSAFDPLDEKEFEAVKLYVEKHSHKDIWTVDKPCTVNEMKSIIESTLLKYQKPLIVTIDHSVLVAKGATEKDTFETLHALAKMMTDLKKKYKIMFLVLSQLNREVESTERQKPGTYGNYLFDSDIYGGDALLQHADLVFGLNRPSKYNLPVYGPEKYIVEKDLIVLHYLKNRNGKASTMSFFKEEFRHMRLIETETPSRRQS